MDINNMIIELIDVFVYEEKNQSKKKKQTEYSRPFSALSMRIGSRDTTYYCAGDIIKAKNGDICFVPQNTEYVRTAQQEKIIVFHFNIHNFVDSKIKCYRVKDTQVYQKMFYDALEIWQAKSSGYRYEATSLVYAILARLQKGGMLLDSSEDKTLSEALQMIEANFKDTSFRIDSISKELFVSSANIRQKFKDKFSFTPKEYLDKRRIAEAEIMLKSKYFTQKEIASECGFSDVKYFRYAFRKETGKTVSDYKKSL